MRSEEGGNGGGSGGTEDDVRGSGLDASVVGLLVSGGGFFEGLGASFLVGGLLGSLGAGGVLFSGLLGGGSGGGGASLEGLSRVVPDRVRFFGTTTSTMMVKGSVPAIRSALCPLSFHRDGARAEKPAGAPGHSPGSSTRRPTPRARRPQERFDPESTRSFAMSAMPVSSPLTVLSFKGKSSSSVTTKQAALSTSVRFSGALKVE